MPHTKVIMEGLISVDGQAQYACPIQTCFFSRGHFNRVFIREEELQPGDEVWCSGNERGITKINELRASTV